MTVQNRSELGKKGEELAKEFYQKNHSPYIPNFRIKYSYKE